MSPVSLRLLRSIVIFLDTIVNEFDRVCILPSGHWLLPLLIRYKWFIIFDIINFTICESNMIPFICTSPNRG